MEEEIKKNKNIWYFHHYATPTSMSGLARPNLFGNELVKTGNKVTVFAASYLHYSDENLIKDNKKYIIDKSTDVDFVFVKTPSSLKSYLARIINMYTYYKRIFRVIKSYQKDNGKPDVIIASSPHPLAMLAGIKIAKKLKIPCICEIRDFWPEVFFTSGVLKENGLIGKLLLKGERWIYKKADAIILLQEGAYKYITDKKWDLENGGDVDINKCYYINNGVNCEEFTKNIENNIIKDIDLENEKFKVIYTGTIRPMNNVDNILDAAKILKNDKNVEFLIYGTGNMVESLQERIKNENISNVKMKGYVEKKYIPYILSKASVNILNYSNSQYNWNRGISSNKMFEYMASGKPIISTVKLGYSPLEKYKCGISVEEYTPKGLADAIIKIANLHEKEYIEMCNNSKKAAYEFDYKNLAKKLENLINEVCKKEEEN